MRVLLDITSLMRTGLTGIGVYTAGLWHALHQVPGVQVEGRWRMSRFGKRHMLHAHVEGRMGPRIPFFSDINLRGFDIYHGPDFRIPRFGRYKRVVTVHDVVVHEQGLVDQLFAEQGTAKLRRTLMEHRPDRVIAISHFTRDRLAALYPEIAPIIDVVPPGIDPERFNPARYSDQAPRLPYAGPFLLMVGSVEKRKNAVAAIRAFERLHAEQPELALVIAGMSGHGADVIDAMIASSPARAGIHRLGFVDDALLAALYRNAEAFIFPSLYEGFGLPIVEAMAAGCPVITSNIGAMAEVAGDAAITVPPTESEAIAAAVKDLMHDSGKRTRLIASGYVRAALFSWDACARGVVETYRRALAS